MAISRLASEALAHRKRRVLPGFSRRHFGPRSFTPPPPPPPPPKSVQNHFYAQTTWPGDYVAGSQTWGKAHKVRVASIFYSRRESGACARCSAASWRGRQGGQGPPARLRGKPLIAAVHGGARSSRAQSTPIPTCSRWTTKARSTFCRAVSDLPCNIRREGGQSLVIGGPSLVILEGKACNPL